MVYTRRALSQKIEVLNLSVRAYNGCRNRGIVMVRDLLKRNPKEMLQGGGNFGRKSLREIQGIMYENRRVWKIPEDHPMIVDYPRDIASLSASKRRKQPYVKQEPITDPDLSLVANIVMELPSMITIVCDITDYLRGRNTDTLQRLVQGPLSRVNLANLAVLLEKSAKDLETIHRHTQIGASQTQET